MNAFVRQGVKWGLPLGMVIVVIGMRMQPAWAEWYARGLYPVVSDLLSAFSYCFPFSVGDVFIVLGCAWLVVYPFYAWRRRQKWQQAVGKMVRFLMWVYVWFYMAWGVNYFRQSFYERAGVEKVAYDATGFQEFVEEYVQELNRSYTEAGDSLVHWYLQPTVRSGYLDTLPLGETIAEGYRQIASDYGLTRPVAWLRPKWMLWSGGMSRVGVSGYMGPFFSEFNLNRDLLNVEYPFTYAHELAHRLSIAGEAEANLYAYLVTTRSSVAEVRFSGYFSLLGYVMNNARRLLPQEAYRQMLQTVRPEIVRMYNDHLTYWREKYRPDVGKVQNKVYNAYLKGNQISSGTKNYSEVIGLLMTVRAAEIGK